MINQNSKELYRKLSLSETSIPIFSRPWWLDALCGDRWGVCLVIKGEVMCAAMPFAINKLPGRIVLVTHPPLTQTLGPWLRPSEAKYANRLGQEKDLLTSLIHELPLFNYFHQNWHYSVTNWLPFYWNGFQQTTRYTYRLPQLLDLESIWAGFRENIRRDIRKATERFKLTVREDLTINDFLELNIQVFERQGMRLPYSKELVQRLDAACMAKGARKIFIAEDHQGNRHAGVYIIWDEQSAYYLMGGADLDFRSSGAMSLCMWEAIKFAATVTKSFDFEGSMIEPVERFFRAFGAIQTPYFSIKKIPSKLIGLALCIRKSVR